MLPLASQAAGYEPGQGWRSDTGNFYVSGYANVEVINRFGVPRRLDLDDLSLFAGGHDGRWINPFAEGELAKHTLIREGGDPVKGDLIVERFYNDALLSELDTLRLGKMLTPLGEWNTVHAAPLVPLITRPYTTALGFHAYVSGVNWMHDLADGSTPDFQLYGQAGDEWFKRPITQTVRNFRNVVGGHINIPFGLRDKIGVSFQSGQLIETGEDYTLYGINANHAFSNLRLQSEAIMSSFSSSVLSGATPRLHDNEFGIFGLADYSFTPKWHGVLEYEFYQDHLVDLPSRSTAIAVNYRPIPAMVWKLEYINQTGQTASFAPITTGLKAAFSFLF